MNKIHLQNFKWGRKKVAGVPYTLITGDKISELVGDHYESGASASDCQLEVPVNARSLHLVKRFCQAFRFGRCPAQFNDDAGALVSFWIFTSKEWLILDIWMLVKETAGVQHLLCNADSELAWELEVAFQKYNMATAET